MSLLDADGCRTGKIALLAKHHRKAAPSGIARDPSAVDAAADDEEIDVYVRFHLKRQGHLGSLLINRPARHGF